MSEDIVADAVLILDELRLSSQCSCVNDGDPCLICRSHWMIDALRSDLSRMREALEKVSALSVHDTEPMSDVNTDDTEIAFADGAWFGRWEAAVIARAALSPATEK